MKAVNRQFSQIINGTNQFIIPVFQRDYSWETDQYRQMWTDVLRTGNGNDGGHFLGSFVYVEGSAGPAFSSWLVIDGQQRLTTLTLLLIALRDHIRKEEWSGQDPTPEKIDAYFLKNVLETDERKYKLALRRHDNETLWALVDSKDYSELENKSELVVKAYHYFREQLDCSKVDPAEIYRGIARLSVVDVQLEHQDNPQLVFESLNSTGVALSQSDLIRNYLLMGLPEEEQTELYGEYWSRLENYFLMAGNVPDSFLRDYIALERKSTTQTRADRIYNEFKEFWPPSDADSTAVLLAPMVKFARYYVSFLRPSSMIQNQKLREAMDNVRSGGLGNAHAPLIMRLYDYYERKLLTESDFIRALTLIKSYLLRRAVIGLQTRDYWSVFTRIAHTMSEDDPFESFQVALARQKYSYRFPSDKEFRSAIQEGDLYRLRNCFHILECLENSGQLEPSPTKGYSIEHIMPQNIDKVQEWQAMLGGQSKWKDVHDTWLHRLGNLTLTAYNGPLSNKPFSKKKPVFEQAAVRITKYVKDQGRWTEFEMEERGHILAERARVIWPHHEADEKLIQNVEVEELLELADQQSSDTLDMNPQVRELLHATQDSIRGLSKAIEVIEHKSVCYYDYSASFLAEILPMASYVRLLIPLDFDAVDDPEGLAGDVHAWKFLPNVSHRECGVFIDIKEKSQIEAAIPMVRQGLDVATN